MNKKNKTSSDIFLESLTPEQRTAFDEGYREFALSELILAMIEQEDVSVRKLTKIACIAHK